jgi:hypothetical protein
MIAGRPSFPNGAKQLRRAKSPERALTLGHFAARVMTESGASTEALNRTSYASRPGQPGWNAARASPLNRKLRRCGAIPEGRPMNLIGRIVTKLLGNENRPIDRDDRNASSATPIGRLVTKILGK